MTLRNLPPDDLWPLTQDNAETLFDYIFAPWIKEMGLTDFMVREGFCSMRLPLNDRLKFFSGAVCGQAVMAAIDTVASMATATTPRQGKGTVYQHTHFLRPAANDDVLIAATVKRWGKASVYVECSVTFVGSGDLVAHAVLEFAF
ncbi:PaaI family thioesterase [Sphingomonas sp. SUN039]|uniref:PaaI family thioesterase n=1 Tax=Sphingomonas sp. SUN039 TaxID=2937787 RepID=UPI002164CD77|nr:PaaI family thioesterase [Sphingomonas sp. SUN039]UVO52585.1 PaaI family thioesterase [Sphingomonas sp. SUN039]